jgi:ribonuclease VapC
MIAIDTWALMAIVNLNFGDCFAYYVAEADACRLLYVGDAFSETDQESAL